jgi:hypothetical protein
VIFVYPIEHRICGLSLVIAIFFFFLSAWDTCAPITVWCVCLCVTSWDYLDWSTSFSFFSGGFVVYLYKIEEGRRAFDSIQTQQVNERRRRLVLFYFHIEKVISFFCFFVIREKKRVFFSWVRQDRHGRIKSQLERMTSRWQKCELSPCNRWAKSVWVGKLGPLGIHKISLYFFS